MFSKVLQSVFIQFWHVWQTIYSLQSSQIQNVCLKSKLHVVCFGLCRALYHFQTLFIVIIFPFYFLLHFSYRCFPTTALLQKSCKHQPDIPAGKCHPKPTTHQERTVYTPSRPQSPSRPSPSIPSLLWRWEVWHTRWQHSCHSIIPEAMFTPGTWRLCEWWYRCISLIPEADYPPCGHKYERCT